MTEKAGPEEPRYVLVTEAVTYTLAGYFQLRLGIVQRELTKIWDERDRKQMVRDRLPKNPIARWLAALPYGDLLTDYETKQIADLRREQVKLTEIMTEILSNGRVDRAAGELRRTITSCFSYLTSFIREDDYISRKMRLSDIEMAEAAIEALAVINPDEARLFSAELDRVKETEEFLNQYVTA